LHAQKICEAEHSGESAQPSTLTSSSNSHPTPPDNTDSPTPRPSALTGSADEKPRLGQAGRLRAGAQQPSYGAQALVPDCAYSFAKA
jgi:hypothetical protein